MGRGRQVRQEVIIGNPVRDASEFCQSRYDGRSQTGSNLKPWLKDRANGLEVDVREGQLRTPGSWA